MRIKTVISPNNSLSAFRNCAGTNYWVILTHKHDPYLISARNREYAPIRQGRIIFNTVNSRSFRIAVSSTYVNLNSQYGEKIIQAFDYVPIWRKILGARLIVMY